MKDDNIQPIGKLFGVINYSKMSELDKFISDMTHDHSLYVLVQAARDAHRKGVFTMEESEVVSKAIRMLTTPQPLPEDGNVE